MLPGFLRRGELGRAIRMRQYRLLRSDLGEVEARARQGLVRGAERRA